MNAGDMDQKIKIQKKSITRADTGEAIETWSDFASVWARVKDFSGREFFAAQAEQSEITTSFLIYHIDGLTYDMRVSYNGDYYDIEQIIRMTRREGIEIMASRRGSG